MTTGTAGHHAVPTPRRLASVLRENGLLAEARCVELMINVAYCAEQIDKRGADRRRLDALKAQLDTLKRETARS